MNCLRLMLIHGDSLYGRPIQFSLLLVPNAKETQMALNTMLRFRQPYFIVTLQLEPT
jgi:hypothetical protein